MGRFRFLPQDTMDRWVDQGRADLQGNHLVELASGVQYPVREALRFLRVESGADSHGLLHKVITLEQLKAVGAEHAMTSVILGETVYEVVPGWIAEETAAAGTQLPPRAAGAASAGPKGKGFEGKNPDADALARLLLDKLS
jgi:hypothetical protein